MKNISNIMTSSNLKLNLPLFLILLIILSILSLYYFYAEHSVGGVNHNGGKIIGIDLTSIDDIKTMRSEMIDLAVKNVKYIRSNYNQKLQDIAKALWMRRGNSDQWSMAIATDSIDNYKAGDIIWCGDPGLLCSGNIPFCNLASDHLNAMKKNQGNISLNELIGKSKDSQLKVTLESGDIHGTTWIVSLGTVKTRKGVWIKRSEGLAYPINDRRIILFIFGVYDYTGILYDFDKDFQTQLAKSFGFKN